MSFSTAKISLPIVMFFAGMIPWIAMVSLISFYEPIGHGDPLISFVALVAIVVAPICFLIGFFQTLKFTGKHRNIGFALNGMGLGVLVSMFVYGWLAN